MASKRLRDWFFTTTSVAGLPGKRFLRNDKPTEGTFRDFLFSIAFKLNPEDTATDVNQGLARKATDEEVAERDGDIKSDGFQMFVAPEQIPAETGWFSAEIDSAMFTVTGGGGFDPGTGTFYWKTSVNNDIMYYTLELSGPSVSGTVDKVNFDMRDATGLAALNCPVSTLAYGEGKSASGAAVICPCFVQALAVLEIYNTGRVTPLDSDDFDGSGTFFVSGFFNSTGI